MDNLKSFNSALGNTVRLVNQDEESEQSLGVFMKMTVREMYEFFLNDFPDFILDMNAGEYFKFIGSMNNYDDFGRLMDEMG